MTDQPQSATPATDDERLALIERRHFPSHPSGDWCGWQRGQTWPCDAAWLLARLREALEATDIRAEGAILSRAEAYRLVNEVALLRTVAEQAEAAATQERAARARLTEALEQLRDYGEMASPEYHLKYPLDYRPRRQIVRQALAAQEAPAPAAPEDVPPAEPIATRPFCRSCACGFRGATPYSHACGVPSYCAHRLGRKRP